LIDADGERVQAPGVADVSTSTPTAAEERAVRGRRQHPVPAAGLSAIGETRAWLKQDDPCIACILFALGVQFCTDPHSIIGASMINQEARSGQKQSPEYILDPRS
jgi:hypothetical protein